MDYRLRVCSRDYDGTAWGGSKSGLVVVSRSRDNQAEKNDVNVVRLEGTAQDSDTNRLTQANCKTNEAFSLQILASQKNTI